MQALDCRFLQVQLSAGHLAFNFKSLGMEHLTPACWVQIPALLLHRTLCYLNHVCDYNRPHYRGVLLRKKCIKDTKHAVYCLTHSFRLNWIVPPFSEVTMVIYW